jgi:hypothetical protein
VYYVAGVGREVVKLRTKVKSADEVEQKPAARGGIFA